MAEWPCAACSSDNPDGTRFCGHCGARRTAGVDRGEERRLVTALFADLSGFTTLMQTGDPETVAAVIDPLVASLSDTVASLGGTVEKYAGDAVLAVFGAPIAHEDDAARALRAAIRMHGIVARYPESQGLTLTLHAGVDSGWTLVRSFGGAGRSDYGALGTSIITAQRLESQAGPEETYVGDTTHTLTQRAFAFEQLEQMTLKGINEPVQAWKLINEDAPADEAPTELFGREHEMAELGSDLDVAAKGIGRVRLIIGEPGVGKSRMVQEVTERAGATGFTVLKVNFVESADRPYQAWLDAFSVLLADRPELIEVLAGTNASPLNPELLHTGLRASGINGLTHVASSAPVLLVAEDLHWAPAIDLDLLGYLAGRISGLPVYVLATSRRGPNLLDDAVPEVRTMQVGVLDDAGIAALAEALIGAPLEAESARALAQYCGGNPLFCHQMLLSLRERGDLVGDSELRFTSVDVLADLPPTVEGLMASRLDLLPVEAAQLASVMAVSGLSVSRRLLREIETESLHGNLDASLEALAAQGFVTDLSQPVVRFAHALIRQAAANRLTSRKRAETHALLADAVLAVYGDSDEGLVFRARHLAGSGNSELAIPALRRASEVQRRVFANDEALALLERAVELASDGADPPADLLLEAADQAELLGRYEQALGWYERAGDYLPAWVGRSEVLRKTGRFDDAREVATAGLERFADHPTASAALLLQDGHARLSAGEYGDAAQVLANALEQAPRAGTLRTTIEVHLADALAMSGRTEEAVTYGESAMASATAVRDQSPRLAVTVARALGGVLQDADRWEDAAETLQQGLDLARRLGDIEEQGACHINIGLCSLHFERFDEAVVCFTDAIALFEQIGHATGCLVGYGNLATALGQLGQVDEALAAADHAEQLALKLGDQFTTLDVALTRAEILIGLGRGDEAALIANEAAQALEALGVPAQAQRAVELAERARSDQS